MISAYFMIQKFQNYVNNNSNVFDENKQKFFHILHDYVNNFNISRLNNERITLLNDVCNCSKIEKFSWTKSIGEFFDRVFPPNLFAKFICPNCTNVSYQHFSCVKLTLEEANVADLTSLIWNKINSGKMCNTCTHNILLSDLEVSNVLSLDVEGNEPELNNSPIFINNIQTTLLIANKTLILVGVVAFEEPIGTNTLRHYVAYCRSLQGCWTKYDDASRDDRPIKVKNIAISIGLLIYVAYETSNYTHMDKLKLEKIEPNARTELSHISTQNLDSNVIESINNDSVDLSIDYGVIKNSSVIFNYRRK